MLFNESSDPRSTESDLHHLPAIQHAAIRGPQGKATEAVWVNCPLAGSHRELQAHVSNPVMPHARPPFRHFVPRPLKRRAVQLGEKTYRCFGTPDLSRRTRR